MSGWDDPERFAAFLAPRRPSGAVAFYTGGNWRDLADFAIRQTLAVPQPGYPAYNPKNDTWSYKAPVQIKDGQGNVRTTYWPLVSVAARDGKIITSFPTRDPS